MAQTGNVRLGSAWCQREQLEQFVSGFHLNVRLELPAKAAIARIEHFATAR